MNVKSKQYSGRSWSSAIATLFLPHRFFQDAAPAHTSCAIDLRSDMVRVTEEEEEEEDRRGLMRSVKYDKARNWPLGKVSSRDGW